MLQNLSKDELIKIIESKKADDISGIYIFEYCSSEGSPNSFIFKANSELQVAGYILAQFRKKNNCYIEPFLYGFVPYCCTDNAKRLRTKKEITQYIVSLDASELIDVLRSTHTHSGGDTYEYSIKKASDIIDLTYV